MTALPTPARLSLVGLLWAGLLASPAHAAPTSKTASKTASKAAPADAPPLPSPHLPSPNGAIYTHRATVPSDAVVAGAMGGAPWDEVLSGVASAVALEAAEGRDVDAYSLRWKAVLAAYPYPIVERAMVRVPAGTLPADLITTARSRATAGMDVGLVHARTRDDDVWVLLVGQAPADLPPVARESRPGETLELGRPFVAADPSGRVRTATHAITLDLGGEWLVSVRDDNGSVATMPFYVGVPTPTEAPILNDAQGSTPEAQARDLLGALSNWYGRGTPTFDDGLDLVARLRLKALVAGDVDRSAEELARSTGQATGAVSAGDCRADGAAACLDGMWWSPERRAVLIGDYTRYGVAAAEADGKLVMVIVGAE